MAYVLTAGVFLWICAQFYVPGKGFTYLIRFGAHGKVPPVIPELNLINHYEEEDTSSGYDAQYYAQIAMHPWLGDDHLKSAVDSLPYRARRILFAWTAYGLALGDPARALHIYAVQNIACWLALAALLLRWFPPVSWGNFIRWFGVLFSSGLCLSVRGSLVDGPSLLFIAAGVALVESGRSWWSAALLGVSGLGRETNILAAVALFRPGARSLRTWGAIALQAALVVLPLAAWLCVLRRWIGGDGMSLSSNFDWPFVAYVEKWRETLDQLSAKRVSSYSFWSLLMILALTVQWLFFALRPRWSDPWWRVGAAYAGLMAVLGNAVWEGYPGAASRVLLPMMLAFNILVPRGRRWGWWLVLLLGNLTAVFSSDFLKPPGNESYQLHGPRALIMIESSGQRVEAQFDNKEWYRPERSRFSYWRWSPGSASVTLHNPLSFAIMADIAFDLNSNDRRQVAVKSGGSEIWSGTTVRRMQHVAVPQVRLEPGDTVWRFETDAPAELPDNGDPRRLAFSLRNFDITVSGRAPTGPAKP